MTRDLVNHLAEFKGHGLLLDTNLLLALTIGLQDPLLISRHKRTGGTLHPEDFDLILELIEFFGTTVTTPNLLTEVSNLLGQSRKGFERELFRRFVEVIASQVERYVPSNQIAAHDQFAAFGLTDIGILEVASREKCLVLTLDSGLIAFLRKKGVGVLEFHLLRDLNQA
jgi:rRNA-processing protein FCF1